MHPLPPGVSLAASTGGAEDYSPPKLCPECKHHQGSTLEKRAQRAESHASKYWDRTEAAVRIAYECGEKMQHAYGSRDRLLGMLNPLTASHYPNGKSGCACGAKDCDLMQLLEDSWVRGRLSDFRERQAA
jgi:hypothetical protein